MISYPLVSVFMPVYNQEHYVAAALDSVLQQTYENYEIIISDDCSNDLTPIIVKQYAEQFPQKIHFHKLSNKNLGDTHFHLLLEKCKGDYVCMFSGDDLMYPEKIARQIEDVVKFDLSFHGHAVDCVDKFGVIFGEISIPKKKIFNGNVDFILNGAATAGCSWMIKRSFIKFNQSLGFLHDFDMVVRALGDHRIGYLSDKKMGAYRVTKESWSRNLKINDYFSSYLGLVRFWVQDNMYSECLWLILGLFKRILSHTRKVLIEKWSASKWK